MTRTTDVIIVNHNTKDDLVRCLQSLHDHRPAAVARILVVDNASTDDSIAAVHASFADVEVLPMDRNVGFAAANNAGIRAATAPLTLLLNSDTVVPPGAVDRLVERLTATGVTAVGPRLVDGGGRPEISFGRMLSPLTELAQRVRMRLAASSTAMARRYVRRLLEREREVDWVTGACLLVRRDAAIAAGLLDERFFLYEEDVDFCAALRARGGRVLFTPAAEVVHLRGQSVRRDPRQGRTLYDRSHVSFYEKHHPGWAPVLRWWLRLRGRG
jgi:N-acetylglucosaminyl-diphospho-decaprenol L-rhamnosyltransferase